MGLSFFSRIGKVTLLPEKGEEVLFLFFFFFKRATSVLSFFEASRKYSSSFQQGWCSSLLIPPRSRRAPLLHGLSSPFVFSPGAGRQNQFSAVFDGPCFSLCIRQEIPPLGELNPKLGGSGMALFLESWDLFLNIREGFPRYKAGYFSPEPFG